MFLALIACQHANKTTIKLTDSELKRMGKSRMNVRFFFSLVADRMD
jgi:hypothetical protein